MLYQKRPHTIELRAWSDLRRSLLIQRLEGSRSRFRHLCIFNGVAGSQEVAVAAVRRLAEKVYGLHELVGVMDGRGARRSRIGEKNLVRRQDARGLIVPKYG